MSGSQRVARGNLYDTADIVHRKDSEHFATLLQTGAFKLERIVSRGQATPEAAWYDQQWDEWVVLLAGAARVCVEGLDAALDLGPGDWLWLPAHVRHRVDWTDPDRETVWLALHLGAPGRFDTDDTS